MSDFSAWESVVEYEDGQRRSWGEWKRDVAEAKAPSNPEDIRIFRGIADAIVIDEANDSSRTIKAIITGPEVDRMGDTIDPDGWDFSMYQKNPVVLWAHDHGTPPVGRSLKIWKSGTKWMSEDEFAPAHAHELAETIYQLVKGKFLNATSVGMIPREYDFDEENWTFSFRTQELIEHSIVPVPAYPKALITARSAGANLAPLRTFCERFLDEFHDESGLWIAKSKIKALTKALGSGRGLRFFDMDTDEIKSFVTERTGEDIPVIPDEIESQAEETDVPTVVLHFEGDDGDTVVLESDSNDIDVEELAKKVAEILSVADVDEDPQIEETEEENDEPVFQIVDDEPEPESVFAVDVDALSDELKAQVDDVKRLITSVTGRIV
jgi:HK97 family phage prohead protease